MSNIIQFRRSVTLDTKPAHSNRLERIKMRKGETLEGRSRPHIIERPSGPVEAADFEYEGGVLLNVPCEAFRFLDDASETAEVS